MTELKYIITRAVALAAATLAIIVIACTLTGCVPTQYQPPPVCGYGQIMQLPGTGRPQPPPQRQPYLPGNGQPQFMPLINQ